MGPLAYGLLLSALLNASAAAPVAAQDGPTVDPAAGTAASSEEGAAPDSPSVEAVLANARATIADLEYDGAASLLTEVIVDPDASVAQQTEARRLLAEVEVIRGFNSEARTHYLWLLERDPSFAVDEGAPPKISGFFRIVRDDWQQTREQEARLLAAAEREASERARSTEAERAAQAQAEAQRQEREQLRAERARLKQERGRTVSDDEPTGSPELLSASLVAYAAAALAAMCFCAPGLIILLNAPEAALVGGCCLGVGVLAGCGVPQGLGTVFLGDTVGKTRSRWAYATTLLAALGSFIVGGVLISLAAVVGLLGIGALFALTPLSGSIINAADSDAAGLGAVALTAVVAALFVALQPLVPIIVYALHGGDAPEHLDPIALNEQREHGPARQRVASMAY